MSDRQIWTNNGRSTLAAGIGTGAMSFSVASGEGARFPSPAAGEFFEVTIINGSGNYEILKCSARSGDAITVAARAQQGTTALTFSAGHSVELRETSGALARFAQKNADEAITGDWTAPEPAGANSVTPRSYVDLAASGHGCCRLVLSGGNLVLAAFNGASLIIGDTLRRFTPNAPSLPATGLTPDTTYNIYAYWDGSEVKLLASTDAHTTWTNGLEIRTGNAGHMLVGMARCVSGPSWVDSTTRRLVLSWFNRRDIIAKTQLVIGAPAILPADGGAIKEVHSSLRLDFLCWAGTLMKQTARASVSHDTGSGNYIQLSVALATPSQGNAPGIVQVPTALAGHLIAITAENNGLPGEGYFSARMYTSTGGGNTHFEGSAGYTSNEVVVEG